MIKKIIFLFIILGLFGCSDTVNITSQLDDVFYDEEVHSIIRTNNYTQYVNYYLPSDVQEESANSLSYIFTYNHSKIIMDVNVSGIINSKYYEKYAINDEGFFDKNKMIYSHEGNYSNSKEKMIPYFYHVYNHNDDYLAYFVSQELIFYVYTNMEDLIPVTSRILLIAKGANIANDDIIYRYSSKDVIDYQKKQVNLFETIMPVNGNINEFLIGTTEDDGE